MLPTNPGSGCPPLPPYLLNTRANRKTDSHPDKGYDRRQEEAEVQRMQKEKEDIKMGAHLLLYMKHSHL
jgi:hypothetical protein